MLKLTNSLTKQLEDLAKKPGEIVSMYSCGPTVYDHAHIGNLRSFIMDDLLRRTIKSAGYELHSIMNITDVDDKTIASAKREYPDLYRSDPKAALAKSTQYYTGLLLADLKSVGINLDLFTIVKATDDLQMKRMGELIDQISDKGFAYVADGSVYFDLAKYREKHSYGLLVNVDFGHQKARIDNDEYDKAEAQDFVLWKATRSGEPSWDLKLGDLILPGRPGWHIECSAMSIGELGQPFDIHTGGIDLKFPHHENEIAQTKASSGKDTAQFFIHWNHLFVEGKKMSKSLENFYTRPDIEAKAYSPRAFRILTMQAHYSNELNFTWHSLEAATNRLININRWADLTHQRENVKETVLVSSQEYLAGLTTDVGAIAALMQIEAGMDKRPDISLLKQLDRLIGLDLSKRPDITADQKKLIEHREAARALKNFAESDKLRDQLLADGLEIDDTPEGPLWHRTKL